MEASDCAGSDGETLQVTLQREWNALARLAELRRAAARRLLDHLLASLPPGEPRHGSDGRDDAGQAMLSALKSDMTLKSAVKDEAMPRLMDRALLWLHEQEVIRLNKGLTVFRPAMTIRLAPEIRGFANTDFASLKLHYDEQVLPIHVMAEYVQQGLEAITEALRLAMDYFSLHGEEFLTSLAAGPGQGGLAPDHSGILAYHRREPEESRPAANRGRRSRTDERPRARRSRFRQDSCRWSIVSPT